MLVVPENLVSNEPGEKLNTRIYFGSNGGFSPGRTRLDTAFRQTLNESVKAPGGIKNHLLFAWLTLMMAGLYIYLSKYFHWISR